MLYIGKSRVPWRSDFSLHSGCAGVPSPGPRAGGAVNDDQSRLVPPGIPSDEAPDPLSPQAAGSSRAPATITDYVSGRQVRATPEEIDAVQVFSKRLVEELGYPKT